MNRVFLVVFACFALNTPLIAADEKFIDCGPGFVAANGKNRDGIAAIECKKLWCKDLENGKSMGSGNSPATGYISTLSPVQLCDSTNRCIECFGDRKWCPGVPNENVQGTYNPELGVYTRAGANGESYNSSLSGNCYRWTLVCESGTVALGNIACVVSGSGNIGRTAVKSRALRRTSGITAPLISPKKK